MYRTITKPSAESSFRKQSHSRRFVIDFRQIYRKYPQCDSLFYFYPQGVEGFIMSCTMNALDDREDCLRDMGIYNEIRSAMNNWINREEDSHRAWNVSYNRNERTEDYEIRCAMNIAGPIEELVRDQLYVLQDLYGNYTVDVTTMLFTSAHALIMTVWY